MTMTIEENANKYLQENKLTFADDSLFAHFLERDSRIDVNHATGTDPRMNLGGISAGVDQFSFKSKNQSINGVPLHAIDEFKLVQMYKSLDHLMARGETTDSIAKMMEVVQKKLYKDNMTDNNRGIVAKNPDEMKDYLDFALDSRQGRLSKSVLDSNFRELNGGEITNTPDNARPMSEMQSLYALGRQRSDYFGDMFSLITTEIPFNALSGENVSRVKTFTETAMRLSDMGGALLASGKSNELKYAVQLNCV